MKHIVISKFYFLLLVVFFFLSCKKFLDVGNPPDKVAAKYVYQSNGAAAAVLTGIYYDLQSKYSGIGQGLNGMSTQFALWADELSATPTGFGALAYRNASPQNFWTPLYGIIYRVNAALEGISNSEKLNPAVKQQLLGEAKFLRAFCYFYLVNIYGDVPLLLGTDYSQNSLAPRLATDSVYDQIIVDLIDAQKLLNSKYVDADGQSPSSERIRPTSWAATALLARTYLYTQHWSDAITQAGMVIDNKELYDTVPLNQIFLKNSKEAIWQLQPVDPDGSTINTSDAQLYVLLNGPDDFEHPVWISPFLLDSLDNGDKRIPVWLGTDTVSGNVYNYAFKYKAYKSDDPSSEYYMVLRLAEQYLIRAEAKTEMGDAAGALFDLNLIRSRAGLSDLGITGKDALLNAILHERQVELFTEWGHRWFDLKRVDKVDEVMRIITPLKGGVWESYKQWFDIPIGDLKLNKSLKQNDGYPSS